MTKEQLAGVVKNALNAAMDGVTEVAQGTFYFEGAGAGLPQSGEDTILATDADSIKFESSSNSARLRPFYKTKNGLWLSATQLFGRHYSTQQGKVPMDSLKCRTQFNEGVKHELVGVSVRTPDGKTISGKIYAFSEDTKVTFGAIDAGKIYLPASENAYDRATRTMNMDHANANPYATLTVG